jgi:hypothetical protein
LRKPKIAETRQTTPELAASIIHQHVATCIQPGFVVPDSAKAVPKTKKAMEKKEAE